MACANRNRSNTPLGALVTLNNEVYVEAAQALGRRLATIDADDDQQRIHHGFRLCVVRPPSREETAVFIEVLQSSRHWYQNQAEAALQRVGNYSVVDQPAHVTASWIAVARVLMNLDEMIVRD